MVLTFLQCGQGFLDFVKITLKHLIYFLHCIKLTPEIVVNHGPKTNKQKTTWFLWLTTM